MFDFLDLLGLIGGILEIFKQIGEWFILPISAFGFHLEAMK